jgi:RNA polymerase sigma-70 factor (ECF subfamily)
MVTQPVRFETLIEAYHDEIYRYVWRLLHSAGRADRYSAAQDLTQEVFVRAFRGFGRLQCDSNYRAWLYKIATNCSYSALKRHQREAYHAAPFHEELTELPMPAQDSPHEQIVLKEALETVRDAIMRLPPKQKAAIILRHVQELSYDQVAEALECSQDAARANVYQGLRRLRLELRNDEL